MLTPSLLVALALTGPSTPALKHAQPDADANLRSLYDMRELRADIVMPEHNELDDFMEIVFGQYAGVSHNELLEGLYIVEGTQEQFDEADKLVASLRAVVTRSLVVRVECWHFPAEVPISIGTRLPEGGGVIQSCEAITPARRQTTIESTTTHTYINEWSPVVSGQSVGYDPQSESISAGLTATILIGQPEGSMIRAQIQGELVDVSLDERLVEMGGASLPFTSPTITRRRLAADAMIPMNEPVVLQVLPGLQAGSTLVLTLRVVPTQTAIPQRTAPADPTPGRPSRP